MLNEYAEIDDEEVWGTQALHTAEVMLDLVKARVNAWVAARLTATGTDDMATYVVTSLDQPAPAPPTILVAFFVYDGVIARPIGTITLHETGYDCRFSSALSVASARTASAIAAAAWLAHQFQQCYDQHGSNMKRW